MADASLAIRDSNGVVHDIDIRTVPNGDERQVLLIGDGENAGIVSPATEPTLAAVLTAVQGLPSGTYGYAAGTAAGTVDVPVDAQVKRVSVIAGSGGTATVTIAGGATITIPAGGSFDEQIPGDTAAGADVVIGGTVASYYVGWTVA